MFGEVRFGIDNLSDEIVELLKQSRFGLLVNQASIDGSFRYTSDVLAERFPGKLAALFSPQHGLYSEQQDNMIESPHGKDRRLKTPVHSLYSETRRPTPQMLDGLKAFVIDLQDVGTRVYTFVWTALYCVEECARLGIPVVVLDRPNPIGGSVVEGPLLDPAFTSFVGRAAIPMRHGLTIAELLSLMNVEWDLHSNIQVAKVANMRREQIWPEFSKSFVPTSPNMSRYEAAAVYPGQVLFEGTNLSEGRGTTTPFEICGAPFIDPSAWIEALTPYELQGVVFRPIRFVPTFQKWKDQSCGGLFLHITDTTTYRPYRTTVAMLSAARQLWGDRFVWNPPPYEYEAVKMPIDILAGSSALRESIDAGRCQNADDLDAICRLDEIDWNKRIQSSLLYR